MFNLFIKTLKDKKYFILGWSLGLAFLGLVMMSFFTSFSGGEIDKLMQTMPPALQGLIGDLQDWRNLPGFIGSQVFDIRLPIFISVLSILLAVGLTVGEEDKGQLRTLIGLPVSRTNIITAKWLAIVVICLIASLATLAGVAAGIPLTGESLDPMVLVRLGLFTWLMVTALATVIFAIGLGTGSRAATTGIGIVLTIASFLLTTFAQAVDWLKDYEWLSFLYYFPATDIAKGTIEWGNVVFYVVVTLISLIAVYLLFPRRDIRTN